MLYYSHFSFYHPFILHYFLSPFRLITVCSQINAIKLNQPPINMLTLQTRPTLK